ncbi:MAG: hypothetical protein JNG90_01315 [Planctomycetaceae bacterium]|nr:hypothetical protein [Planctomycetaceae bacterium]
MRGILAAFCLLGLGLSVAAPAAGDDLKFRPPERARVRLSDGAAAETESSGPDSADAEADREPPRSSPRRRRDENVAPARYVERDVDFARESDDGPEHDEGEEEYSESARAERAAEYQEERRQRRPVNRRVEHAVAYEDQLPGRVMVVQNIEPLGASPPGSVTLGAPVFDPYDAQMHSSLYPAATPMAAPAYGPPPAYSAPPPSGPASWFGFGRPNDMMAPYWRHRTGIYGDFLYLRPRNAEVAYAVPIDGPVAPVIGNGVQNGPTATVNPGWQMAFDVGFSIALCDTASVRAEWTHFDQTTNSSATIAPPDVLRALVTHPLGANAATDTLDANAGLQLKYDLVDIDYSGLLRGDEGYVVNYFGGGRWMQFDQTFNANYTAIGTTAVNSNITFSGGGIRLGLEGERRSCKTGCLVYARGTSNFVVGEFNASYTQTDATGVQIVNNSLTVARIVPMLDLEIGAGWTSRGGRVRLTAGYLISAWFNTVTTDDWIQAVQTTNYNNLGSAITFDGLMARAAVQF